MSTTLEPKSIQVGVLRALIRRLPLHEILWTAGVLLVVAVFTGLYYRQTFEGLSDRRAMDFSQVARNIYLGRGFTTNVIRPFNVALVNDPNRQDIEMNSGPLFPFAVAAAFKIEGGASDQATSWISILFLLAAVVATHLLGRTLFGWRRGLLAALLFGLSAPILEAGTSGTEWTMATTWFTLLLLALAGYHRSTSDGGSVRGICYVAASAVLLTLLYVTNHILLCLLVPLVVYFAVTHGRRRLQLAVFVVATLVLITPWACRNAALTNGSILAANAWDIMSHSTAFPGDQIYRSTNPANLSVYRAILFPVEHFHAFASKLTAGSAGVLHRLIVMLGFAVTPFAVVSMLYRFKIPAANAVRGFVYGAAPLLISCLALYTTDYRGVVMLAPVVAVFGIGYYSLLLDAKALHPVYARTITAAVIVVTCWPALSSMPWLAERHSLTDKLSVNEYFVSLSEAGFSGQVFTDVPWVAALRLGNTAVWLPVTDEDALELTANGLRMQAIILTPESETYDPSETWYLMHDSKLWRDYIANPDISIKDYAQRMGLDEANTQAFGRYMRERRRRLPVSASLQGFAELDVGPVRILSRTIVRFTPDDIVFLIGEQAR